MVGFGMIQKTRKRKYQLIPEFSTTSRLTVPGPHSHPSTSKLRPKRCVKTSGDPWDASQPPGSSLPVYGTPVANGWNLHLALPTGNNHCRSVTFPVKIEPRGQGKKSWGNTVTEKLSISRYVLIMADASWNDILQN